MYGLVNRGIAQLIRAEHGDDVWEEILDVAGIEDDAFLAMEPYDDRVTYDLVSAASQVLGASAEDLLKAFGEFWILFTAQEGYGELLQLGGADVRTFLANLNSLHAQVKVTHPDLEPPSFSVEEAGQDRLRLHYSSKRPGLAPMILGLIDGLARLKDEYVDIAHLPAESREDEHGFHECFEVVLQESRSVSR